MQYSGVRLHRVESESCSNRVVKAVKIDILTANREVAALVSWCCDHSQSLFAHRCGSLTPNGDCEKPNASKTTSCWYIRLRRSGLKNVIALHTHTHKAAVSATTCLLVSRSCFLALSTCFYAARRIAWRRGSVPRPHHINHTTSLLHRHIATSLRHCVSAPQRIRA